MAKRTTRIFDTWLAMFDLLNVPSKWPAHQLTGKQPDIVFGDDSAIMQESVFVLCQNPDDGSAFDRETSGSPGFDERFVIRILIGSRVPGVDQRQALARLKELVAVVETELRNPANGRPAGEFHTSVPGVMTWHVSRISPSVFPLTEPEAGWSGVAQVDVTFMARI